ncbi:MAG TPA: rod shape-determining protein MreD [Polyangia bacterium]
MATLVLFGCALLLLLLQAVLHTLVPTTAPLPAFALLTPLYVGFSPRWSTPGATAFALVVGYVFDLLSGAPTGVHAFATPVIVLLGSLLATALQIRGSITRTLASFVLVAGFGGLVLGLRALLRAGHWNGLGHLTLEATMSAAAAPPLFALFDRIDRRFDRSAVRMRPGRGRDTGIELSR